VLEATTGAAPAFKTQTGKIAMTSQAANDVVIATSATQLGRVANGTTGQVLEATTAGAPAFKTPTGIMTIASQAALDFIYAGSSTQLARLAKGAGLTYPRIDAAGTAWEFADVPVRKLAATVADVANTTDETTVLTFVIPAGTMADGDIIDVTIAALFKNNKTSAGTATWKVNVGAGAQVTVIAQAAADSAAEHPGMVDLIRLTRVGAAVWVGIPPPLTADFQYMDQYSGPSTPANFTAANTVTFTVTLSAAHATFYIKPQSARIKHYRMA
jgi:hypothetical protein